MWMMVGRMGYCDGPRKWDAPNPWQPGMAVPYPEWQGWRKGRSQGHTPSRGLLSATAGNYGNVSASPGAGGGTEGRAWLITEQMPAAPWGECIKVGELSSHSPRHIYLQTPRHPAGAAFVLSWRDLQVQSLRLLSKWDSPSHLLSLASHPACLPSGLSPPHPIAASWSPPSLQTA